MNEPAKLHLARIKPRPNEHKFGPGAGRPGRMTGELISAMVLNVVFAAIALYALYFVIRAAVRDGIKLARTADTSNANNDVGNSLQD
ncbi:hypothetical protein ACFY5D_06825 [Paeniglutamicibacter sp. NPDC012692]|uniref:hypothetical protein n=1 Tax=Paeniglutamicibacter sp. NPDC012692 TaxID=3364388 RepID=UPI0036CA7106